MRWSAHITVAAVLERDSRFLLVQENIAGKRVINQPAGHLEDNETLLQASRREVLEETGWHYQPHSLVGIYHWKSPDDETFLRFCFTGNLLEHEPQRELDPAIQQVLWLEQQEMQKRAAQMRSPLVQKCIDDYLRGVRIDLSVLNHI